MLFIKRVLQKTGFNSRRGCLHIPLTAHLVLHTHLHSFYQGLNDCSVPTGTTQS